MSRKYYTRGVAAGFVAALAPSLAAHAACNAIPGTQQTFRGALGATNRPFAGPGDFVELRQQPVCGPPAPPFSAGAGAHVVTLVFTPPNGPRNVVILSTNCANIEAKGQACEARTDVQSAICQTINLAGKASSLEVVERDSVRRLRFRFPDTDGLVEGANDDRKVGHREKKLRPPWPSCRRAGFVVASEQLKRRIVAYCRCRASTSPTTRPFGRVSQGRSAIVASTPRDNQRSARRPTHARASSSPSGATVRCSWSCSDRAAPRHPHKGKAVRDESLLASNE